MQCSVHTPSLFIRTHTSQLLPTWPSAVASVLVVLQPCPCDLHPRSTQTEVQKRKLRQRFLKFGRELAQQLQQMGHLAEVFDPETGKPILSPPGLSTLDDVAVVRSCLGYPTLDHEGCSVILHPLWGSAVYPSTVLSSAEPETVASLLRHLGLSANHHSRVSLLKSTEYSVTTTGSSDP